MRGLLLPLALSLALITGVSVAQEKKRTPQQERMATCSGEAKGKSLKGDARKAFMKECLSSGKPKKEVTPQQAKMKDCSAKARTQKLKGDARKSFMGTCLKS